MITPLPYSNTSRHLTCDQIRRAQLVVIIRLTHQHEVASVIKCLVEAGVLCLEVTSNTPGFAEEISKARHLYPNILIGAGTVINEDIAQVAIDAGAQFIVTPNTHKNVVTIAHNNDIPVLMGALTPTDIAQSIDYQADFIKVFPAGSLGTQYFKDLQGPFSDTPLIPVGGVNHKNINDWFANGAIAVGVGNDLSMPANTPQEKAALTELAKLYIAKLPSLNE